MDYAIEELKKQAAKLGANGVLLVSSGDRTSTIVGGHGTGSLYAIPVTAKTVAEILALPVQERIHLVELIWESVAAVPQAIEVSPEVKSELAARLVEFERDPDAGYSLDEVKEKLKSGSWRSA